MLNLVFTLETIDNAALSFWQRYEGKTVFAIHGEMGAGKTTFINALCKIKNVQSGVSSPTFSIINQYEYPSGRMYHIDLYRLNDEEDAMKAGVEECLFSGDVCLIEWPEKAERLLPEETIHIHIETVDQQTRRLTGYDK